MVLAPLLGCGGSGNGNIQLPPGGLTLPDCQQGQILGVSQSGVPTCLAPPTASNLTIPTACKPTQALTSDGKALTCVDVATGGANPNNTTITTNTTRAMMDQTTVANLLANPPGSIATYVGSTTTTTSGYFLGTFAGTDNGLTAAADACGKAGFTGAHMCTVDEIYMSVVKGVVSSAKQITTKAWVWAPSWKAPLVMPAPIGKGTATNEPTSGLADNCGTYTYPTNDLGWSGIKVSTGTLTGTNRWGVRWAGGVDALCKDPSPIACCK